MKKCYKRYEIQKIIVLFLFLFFAFSVTGFEGYPLKNTHIVYLHSDQDHKIEGNTDEYHFQEGQYSYIFSNIYDKKDPPEKKKLRKKRMLKFNQKGELLIFYEKDYKNNLVTYDQFSKKESAFYKKEKKIKLEKFKTGVITLATIQPWLQKKINSKKLAEEALIVHTPHTRFINKVTLLASCEKQKSNPYYGKKEPVFVCKMKLQSKTLQSFAKDSGKLAFVFREEKPRLLLTLRAGKKFYYINNYKTIENKEQLLPEIVTIEKEIQNTFQIKLPQ